MGPRPIWGVLGEGKDRCGRQVTRCVYVLLPVPRHEGQVQNQRQPVAVDEEQQGKESVDAGLRHYVHVEAVAQVDGVDVVAFQIGVHDGEEDLEEEVDGIEEDGEEEEPTGWDVMSVGDQEGWCSDGGGNVAGVHTMLRRTS